MSTNNTAQVDVRGPRFAAWITTAVLVATLMVSAFSVPAAAVILGLQAIVFAIGALRGPRQHPYACVTHLPAHKPETQSNRKDLHGSLRRPGLR
jgi:hypothetical protein